MLTNTVSAALDDLNLLHQKADTQGTMVWPLLPNESLAQLAAKFYPHNKDMQRKFILKTKRLNKTKLSANSRHQKVTAITIPNLHTLSVQAGLIKRAKKNPANKNLRFSYNIEPEKKPGFSIKSIPERLIRQYEELLVRNEFLKVELGKLNKRLIFLEEKLGQLTLILDKTLSLPPKMKLKNLDTEQGATEKPQAKSNDKSMNSVEKKKPAVKKVVDKNKVQEKVYLDFSNKLLWLGLALFGLLVVLGSYITSKFREKRYTSLVDAISRQNPASGFSAADVEISKNAEAVLLSESNNALEEQSDESVLQEAKTMMKQGSPDEAIGHLKWAVRAKAQTSIKTWLYLLDILRRQNLKDEFEKFALEMHQNFNVMTPLWEEREVEVVVSQTLEDFPYIVKFLTEKWPNEKLSNYLSKLVSDNRSGERTGFSVAVVEEVLLLIDVLALRDEVEKH